MPLSIRAHLLSFGVERSGGYISIEFLIRLSADVVARSMMSDPMRLSVEGGSFADFQFYLTAFEKVS